MTTGDALLRTILAAPDEDAPRLVYADWLTEQGREEMAAFIRKEITDGDDNAREEFRAIVMAALPSTNGPAFSLPSGWRVTCEPSRYGAYPQHARPIGEPWGRCLARRGFVECVTCDAADWLTHADAITAAHPVREVTLTTRPFGDVDFGPTRQWWGELSAKLWPGITFTLPPEPRRDQYAHWNPVTLEARPAITPIRFTEEMLRDASAGYNAADAVMAAWQREMGIPLPPDDSPE